MSSANANLDAQVTKGLMNVFMNTAHIEAAITDLIMTAQRVCSTTDSEEKQLSALFAALGATHDVEQAADMGAATCFTGPEGTLSVFMLILLRIIGVLFKSPVFLILILCRSSKIVSSFSYGDSVLQMFPSVRGTDRSFSSPRGRDRTFSYNEDEVNEERLLKEGLRLVQGLLLKQCLHEAISKRISYKCCCHFCYSCLE